MDNEEDVSSSASTSRKMKEKKEDNEEELHIVRSQALKNFLVRIKIQM